jgi:hypothetical protein
MKAFDAQLASGTATFTAEVPEGWPAEQDLPQAERPINGMQRTASEHSCGSIERTSCSAGRPEQDVKAVMGSPHC